MREGPYFKAHFLLSIPYSYYYFSDCNANTQNVGLILSIPYSQWKRISLQRWSIGIEQWSLPTRNIIYPGTFSLTEHSYINRGLTLWKKESSEVQKYTLYYSSVIFFSSKYTSENIQLPIMLRKFFLKIFFLLYYKLNILGLY